MEVIGKKVIWVGRFREYYSTSFSHTKTKKKKK